MKGLHKTLSLLLAVALCLGALPLTASAVTFSDVPANAWYRGNVAAVADAGIISGYGNGKFGPADNVTLAQTVKLAAAIHAQLNGVSYDFSGGDPWYVPYGDYLTRLTGIRYFMYDDPNKAVAREQFAEIMHVALDSFSARERSKNSVADGAIPDLSNTEAHQAVYDLYRAGIVIGDAEHRFNSTTNIQRCEVAAIVHRFLDAGQRQSVTLEVLTAEKVRDLTGYVPRNWSWTAEGEGYGLRAFTSGKYVRDDGRAVLYIESSDSPDFFYYQLHVMEFGGKWAFNDPELTAGFGYGVAEWAYSDRGVVGTDLFFEDYGLKQITVSYFPDPGSDFFDYWNDPSGTYYLVREKI